MEKLLPVRVTSLDAHNNLLMSWPTYIEKGSIQPAFRTIKDYLERALLPIYILVDLQKDPQFPMSDTILGAFQAFGHPKLAEWIVFGANPRAKMIGQALVTMTQRNNILWFDTQEEALSYLDSRLRARESNNPIV